MPQGFVNFFYLVEGYDNASIILLPAKFLIPSQESGFCVSPIAKLSIFSPRSLFFLLLSNCKKMQRLHLNSAKSWRRLGVPVLVWVVDMQMLGLTPCFRSSIRYCVWGSGICQNVRISIFFLLLLCFYALQLLVFEFPAVVNEKAKGCKRTWLLIDSRKDGSAFPIPLNRCPSLLQNPFRAILFHCYNLPLETSRAGFLWQNDFSSFDDIWNGMRTFPRAIHFSTPALVFIGNLSHETCFTASPITVDFLFVCRYHNANSIGTEWITRLKKMTRVSFFLLLLKSSSGVGEYKKRLEISGEGWRTNQRGRFLRTHQGQLLIASRTYGVRCCVRVFLN